MVKIEAQEKEELRNGQRKQMIEQEKNDNFNNERENVLCVSVREGKPCLCSSITC